MFTLGTDKSISVTRGDSCSFVAPIDYALKNGDVLRLKVFRKKACEDVVLQKDFAITESTNTVTIELAEKDTRIGEIISKPVDYWYEIELNPDNNPITLVGYDEDGAKIFRLYPEGRDLEDDELPAEEQETFRQLTEEFLEQNKVSMASNTDIDARESLKKTIVPNNIDYAVKVAMSDGKGTEWTEEEKTAARARLGIDVIFNTLQGNLDEVSSLVGSQTALPPISGDAPIYGGDTKPPVAETGVSE